MSLLNNILRVKREEVALRRGPRYLRELQLKIADREPTRPFQKVLSGKRDGAPHLIAEIKKASPSKGVLRTAFDPVKIAATYAEGGAAALSILTEEHFFMGKPGYLQDVHTHVALPILQKDFFLDEIQVYEARVWGADCVLLIAAMLTPTQLKDYFDIARGLSLDILVEVHTPHELEAVVEWAPMMGINNRDLQTFQTSLTTTFQLLETIPEDRIVVSESGIAARDDVKRLYDAGVDAMLIGEAFMVSHDIKETMQTLLGRSA